MIAKNEEQVIGRAIDSCSGVVDEIILVDTGSEDRTVEIAKTKGAKIYFFAWKNDFAAAKNYALSKAKGDWIVFLDADEYFGNDTGKNLRKILTSLESRYNALVTYLINFDSQDNKQLDMMIQARVFKRDKNIRYVSPIHEALYNFKEGENIKAFFIEEKELVIFHTGYSRFDRGIKASRNLEMLLEQIKNEENPHPGYYMYLSDCYVGLGDWEKSIEYARKYIGFRMELQAYRTRAYQNIIDSMMKIGRPVLEVMQEVELAIEKFPNHPQFFFYKSYLLFENRKYDEAIPYLLKTLELHQNYRELEINSLAINIWYVYNALGAVYELKGECESAIYYYQIALQKDWDNVNCCDRLIRLLRDKPLKEVTKIIEVTFDVNNEECLDFLLKRLVNVATPELLAHYVVFRQKVYPKQDFILLQMLLANKYYSKVVPILVECVRSDNDERLALITAAAIMLAEDEAYYDSGKILPSSLKNIFLAYFGKENSLEGISPQLLVEFVHIFLLWGTPKQVGKILNIRNFFDFELIFQLCMLLADRRHFQTACDIYQDLIFQRKEVGGVIYYNYGYCLHQLNKSEEALLSLIQAYDVGYRENDLYEVMSWVLNKVNSNDELKFRGQEILNMRLDLII